MENVQNGTMSIAISEDKPVLNVVSKEEFSRLVSQTFESLGEVLSKSFGPYGANTLIFRYPDSHSTKDGFTIMKSVSFDIQHSLKYQAIADLVSTICGRLNTRVGDGTTTSVIATNSIYKSYKKMQDYFDKLHIMPREILEKYDEVKKDILTHLLDEATPIAVDDREELAQRISDVVYISSNGDEKLTEMISDIYREIGAPAITIEKGDKSETECEIIKGYNPLVYIGDMMFSTTEDGTVHLPEADILIFGACRVTEDIYRRIIEPAITAAASRRRKLLVLSAAYDELCVIRVIKPAVENWIRTTHSTPVIFCAYKNVNPYQTKCINDFAMLCNTELITRGKCQDLIEAAYDMGTGQQIAKLNLNFDNRDRITNLKVLAVPDHIMRALHVGDPEFNVNDLPNYVALKTLEEVKASNGQWVLLEDRTEEELKSCIHVGFARDITLTVDKNQGSLFKKFYYDDMLYDIYTRDAAKDLKKVKDIYSSLGTFNLETGQAMKRVQALKLKTAVIKVGGDSTLSADMTRDQVDDAVRAAASAFEHGTVLGCNVSLLRATQKAKAAYIARNGDTAVGYVLAIYDMIYMAFRDVYATILRNAYPSDPKITAFNTAQVLKFVAEWIGEGNVEDGKIREVVEKRMSELPQDDSTADGVAEFSLFDIIIDASINTNTVFDVSEKTFSKFVINSTLTDYEVLNATADLVRLLIAGNQIIMTQKRSF